MNTDIERFKMLFECYNQSDEKLTNAGIAARNKLYETITELYNKINM
jgi:hypothetical protein